MTKAMYVHVPFCDHICAYCDFTRCGYYQPLAEQWLCAIKKELQEKSLEPCISMYIGGGTPSALSESQLKTLLEALAPYTEHVSIAFRWGHKAFSLTIYAGWNAVPIIR